MALLTLIAASATAVACRPAAAEPTVSPRRFADVRLARDSEIVRALVPQRTTLASVLNTHQLLAHEAVALVRTISEKFDLRRVRAGQPYRLDRFLDGRVREFQYEIDVDRRIVVRRRDGPTEPTFDIDVETIQKKIEQVTVTGVINRETPSLVQAMDAAGERVELSLALADIFSGEIDFNNDLQPGDTFRLVVDRATRIDGVFAGYGPVLAAEYI